MIIGLSGHIKSGKSTAATLVKQYNESFIEKYFAYKLKFIAAYLTGDDIRNFETQEGKEGYLEEWGMTRRKMLQQLGTESLRNNFYDQVWIKALFADYKRDFQMGADTFESPSRSGPYPNWIISDVRFPNEANEIKKKGGKILRINRSFSHIYSEMWNEYIQFEKSRKITIINEKRFIAWLSVDNKEKLELYAKLTHPSEISLDEYNDFDFIIDNNGTVGEFEQMIEDVLTKLNL